TLLVNSFRTILTQYPRYESRFLIIYETIASMFNLPFNEDISLFKNLWDQAVVRSFVQNITLSLSSTIFQFLKDTLVVFLFIFFFLSEMRFFRDKLKAALADIMPNSFKSAFTDVVAQIARYISVKFYISLLTGILVYLGTLLIGLDFPVIWGFIAFVLNFIPTFGSIISGILTSVFALVQFWPEPAPVILTVLLMIGVNMILGNIVEPKIQGRNLGLSPFVIIVSLSVWGWIWGFAGMVLAVPIMVVIKIICENIEILHPVSILLGTVVESPKNEEETKQ
ncbi:MAG TPA: AI-2E family transporter, partial [Treponemataceae bacterium]|nr:AI-2E family transporter [Treponemataceae bacterium]